MALAILLLPVLAQAQDKQDQKVKKERKGEFYFAWG